MENYFLRKVWDPAGRCFEVNPERASDLVLNKGWFNTPPENRQPRKMRGRKKTEKAEQAPVIQAVDNEEVETEASAFDDNE